MLNIASIKNAPYNPREMSEEAKKALRTSISTFGEISGIVWNSTTGNLVGGNHRWIEICDIYGKDTITFNSIPNTELHMIMVRS